MKRLLYLTLIIGLVQPTSFCGASYLIEFKSGSKFVTSHYWTTGNQVHFYSRGGVMGVPQTMIKHISNSDQTPQIELKVQPEEQTNSDQTPQIEIKVQPEEQAKPEEQAQENKIELEPEQQEDIGVETQVKKKIELEDNVRLAEQKFKQAAINGNNTEKKAAIQEFLKHRNAFLQYRKEILEENNNELPNWW